MAHLTRVLIIPDVHIPYEDKRAWKLMLAAARDFRPQQIWVMGDFWDCYALSRHTKDPRRANQLPQELAAVHRRLDELDSLNADSKEFIAGNHEDRTRRYLCDKAPELFGVVDVPSLLRLPERGWHYTPYKCHTKVGKAHLTHDVGRAGRYAVYRLLDRFQHTVVGGHTHRLQMVVEGNAVGEQKLAVSFGWLGDREKVDYEHRVNVFTDCALGFGIGYLDNRGVAYLVPVPIVNYRCVVEGRLYGG